MRKIIFICMAATLLFPNASFAQGKFKKVITVIFENTDYSKTMKQPFFSDIAKRGALLANFHAEAHPSQPNYIALTSGSTQGVNGDGNVDLDVTHIADLIEAKGLDWKVYAEDYPGHCSQKGSKGHYARKHVPFISYTNVQNDSARCAKIQDEGAFDKDAAANSLPAYSFYVPNLKNDGHDTGVAYADKWFSGKFGNLLNSSDFMKDTLLIVTFDENDGSSGNKIYTLLYGPSVQSGTVSNVNYNHYSLLKLVEDEWNLGSLGLNDVTAAAIDDVWK